MLDQRRERLVEILTRRFTDDELSMEEYEGLMGRIAEAKTLESLETLEFELYEGQRGAASERSEPGRGATFMEESQVQSCVAVLSERQHRGAWLAKQNVASFTLLATQIFDLRDQDLPPGPTVLEVFALLGSVEVIVPPSLSVRMEVTPVLGDATLKRGVNARERSGEPVLVITGAAILGSVTVRTK